MLPGKLDFGSPWVFFLAYNFMKPTTHRVFFGIPVMLWFGGFGLLAGWGLGLRQVVSLALVWLYVPLAWGLFLDSDTVFGSSVAETWGRSGLCFCEFVYAFDGDGDVFARRISPSDPAYGWRLSARGFDLVGFEGFIWGGFDDLSCDDPCVAIKE
jgi:hypothetical protein